MELGPKTEGVGEVKTERRALLGRGTCMGTGGSIVPDSINSKMLAGRIKSALASWGKEETVPESLNGDMENPKEKF